MLEMRRVALKLKINLHLWQNLFLFPASFICNELIFTFTFFLYDFSIFISWNPLSLKQSLETRRVKKLTSVRHKNIIMRVAHGDIYSNERLFRFGLIDNPKCSNCNEAVESRKHRLLECPKATIAWTELNAAKVSLGLNPLSELSIENILGTKDNQSKLELALSAELLHRLAAFGNNDYCQNLMVKMVIRTIGHCEVLEPELQRRFKEMMRDI